MVLHLHLCLFCGDSEEGYKLSQSGIMSFDLPYHYFIHYTFLVCHLKLMCRAMSHLCCLDLFRLCGSSEGAFGQNLPELNACAMDQPEPNSREAPHAL